MKKNNTHTKSSPQRKSEDKPFRFTATGKRSRSGRVHDKKHSTQVGQTMCVLKVHTGNTVCEAIILDERKVKENLYVHYKGTTFVNNTEIEM